ncbi:ABC transporter permease [Pseudonocardia sp. MH-G8]|uniref:ABC transporter permease n=1 Tax=Pseudonocardia sp. MH-G8 TaxID=1854588 RepID=UPI000BA00467|nr:ABC transporter permease subunit [Pseudonocardia sp. MH-G8]OZM81386.1 nitrate ABC transporter permease [Pseudonocardia sp. MH-G8]
MPRAVRGLLGLLAFGLIWEVAVAVGLLPARFLPPPSVVLAGVVELFTREAFLRDVVATVLAWAIALGLAVAVAVPAGLVLGTLPGVRAASRVLVEFLRPIPSVALIPLVVLLVGGGPEAKITLAVYAAAWPILYNTIYAVGAMDPVLRDTARTCGAGPVATMLGVALPHAAPFVFTGVRMAAAIALIVVVSTEFLAGASRGIGNVVLTTSSGAGRVDLVLAATLVAGTVGILINQALERLGERLFGWSTVGTDAV